MSKVPGIVPISDLRQGAADVLARVMSEVIVPPYRSFYRVDVLIVWIVAFWRGAQLHEEPEK
jgi:hypothetical protein